MTSATVFYIQLFEEHKADSSRTAPFPCVSGPLTTAIPCLCMWWHKLLQNASFVVEILCHRQNIQDDTQVACLMDLASV